MDSILRDFECPKCGSDDVEIERESTYDEDEDWFDCECNDCHHRWKED